MNNEPASAFLPMKIGNQWSIDSQNYTEIQQTERVDGKIYYKSYSLIGDDAVSTACLRIDENNQLMESLPAVKGKEYPKQSLTYQKQNAPLHQYQKHYRLLLEANT